MIIAEGAVPFNMFVEHRFPIRSLRKMSVFQLESGKKASVSNRNVAFTGYNHCLHEH